MPAWVSSIHRSWRPPMASEGEATSYFEYLHILELTLKKRECVYGKKRGRV